MPDQPMFGATSPAPPAAPMSVAGSKSCPSADPRPYDHEAANVALRYEVVQMHRVIASCRERENRLVAENDTLREDLADAMATLAEVARLNALMRGMYDELCRDEGSMNGVNNVCELLAAEVER